MINKNKILAIIPARSGSRGLPNKNVKKLNRKPLISYPILAAKKSKFIDDIIVSTDSVSIQKIANYYGASTPFLRPKKFSNNNSTSFEVLKHTIDYQVKNYKEYEYVIMLEPTSPTTKSTDIDKAISKLHSNRLKADSIASISLVENMHPDFLTKINKKGLIEPYNKRKFEFKRRQEISKIFFFDGSLYLSKIKTLLEKKTFNHNRTLPLIMPKYKSFEIDDILDFTIIEAIIKNRII